MEAGPLSQWLYAGLQAEGLTVELLKTRHVRTAFKIMPVKTDRKDARGIAQLMRMGWFRPVQLQIRAGSRSASIADHTQVGGEQAFRHGDGSTRYSARLRPESRPDHPTDFGRAGARVGGWPSNAPCRRRGAAHSSISPDHAAEGDSEAACRPGPRGHAHAAAHADAGRRGDLALTVVSAIDDPHARQGSVVTQVRSLLE